MTLSFFFDPLYSIPIIGTIVLCSSLSLIGALMYVQKQCLIGETLSHSAYPGVIMGCCLAALFAEQASAMANIIILAGALLTAAVGHKSVAFLKNKLCIHSDAALCLILSFSLGIGVLCSSYIQLAIPTWYRYSLIYLFGQIVTISTMHVWLLLGLLIAIVSCVLFKYREIELMTFDFSLGQQLKNMGGSSLSTAILLLLVCSIILGIRCFGVVLIAGVLIAPAASARCFADRFSSFLILSVLFGVLSGFFGAMLSVFFSFKNIIIPFGPTVLMLSISLTLISLFFAPKKGIFFLKMRKYRFKRQCDFENILKSLWKAGRTQSHKPVDIWSINKMGKIRFYRSLFFLSKEGWIAKNQSGNISLTQDGIQRAKRIIRLHRLWELYLVTFINADEKKVHHSAEEIEHILSPNIERRLNRMLGYPQKDPHSMPIPQSDLL